MTATAPARDTGERAVARRILPPPITGQEYVLFGVIVVMWILLGIFTPSFLSPSSIQPLLVQIAPIALIGVGMTFIIITAGIDVSVGGGIALCAVVTAKLLVNLDVPAIVAVLVSIALGTVLGFVNGILTAYGRVHSIIITFGTMNVFQFFALRVFGSSTVNGIPNTLDIFGRGEAGRTLGVPHSFAITIVIVIIAWWYLRHSSGGRHFYAIGGNADAARLAGIKVQPRTVIAYVVTGALVGLGACFIVASGTSTLDQAVGSGRELQVIAAVVIGGTSITGGRGSVIGSLLGAVLVQTVGSGVTQLGWPSQLANFFVGVFIVIAVGTDILRERARRRKQ
ncbi:monosaccharide ABC transporter membrane protein, CUT2 family [Paramicrobacterium humi]|uniref:Monosaccharide ABC transporter membrane protein, CUT2 family n=1 Tax=Paramicrobacterium humi TaxID=640635 RepID=A0A1H4JIY4_9MICO|nr:ABC transporter permease [Microbacterium humi]SEB45618.1 monosaccharide ABC transporter membrane protein, CUT2 family [Microbacterium humi]